METAFRALLTGSAAVTTLVPSGRIEWGLLGQGKALPAIRLYGISANEQGLHMQGAGGLWRRRVQVDCYGATYSSAMAVADSVTTFLHGHRSENFRLILLDSRRDHNETAATDRPYRVGLDFIIHWRT